MKRLLGIIGSGLLLLVFVPLFILLLFAMPFEFVAATWNLCRVDAVTEGVLVESVVANGGKGTSGSVVRYRYTVDGRDYESTRLGAGVLSEGMTESGGGDYARKHPPGSTVVVHYDSGDPGFALVAHGWPKWSVGFSMGVWGIIWTAYYSIRRCASFRGACLYAAPRAVMFVGLLTVILMPETIDGRGFLVIGCAVMVVLPLSMVQGVIRFRRHAASHRR